MSAKDAKSEETNPALVALAINTNTATAS